MNKLARQWMKDLRDNPPKSIGSLKGYDGGYCCLGVAAKGVLKADEDAIVGLGGLEYCGYEKLGLFGALGETLNAEPLRYRGKILRDKENQKLIRSLSCLNDEFKFSHAQHAEIIEENQHILFRKEL